MSNSADQNQQMIPKVAIGAVHHRTRLEVSLNEKILSCPWTELIGNRKKVLNVDSIKRVCLPFFFFQGTLWKTPVTIGCADNRCKKIKLNKHTNKDKSTNGYRKPKPGTKGLNLDNLSEFKWSVSFWVPLTAAFNGTNLLSENSARKSSDHSSPFRFY